MTQRCFKAIKGELFKLFFAVGLLFMTAGRIFYWQAFGYAVINVIFLVIMIFLSVKREDFAELLSENLATNYRQLWWDRLFWQLYWPLYFAIFVIAGLDSGRFGWTRSFYPSVYMLGYALYIIAYIFILWAMWLNRFFSESSCVQREKNHQVVRSGPYHLVRHPGYLGGIFLLLGTALLLGSLWALIPASVNALLLLGRTFVEDKVLREGLDGYGDYSKEVRYRLIPEIW